MGIAGRPLDVAQQDSSLRSRPGERLGTGFSVFPSRGRESGLGYAAMTTCRYQEVRDTLQGLTLG